MASSVQTASCVCMLNLAAVYSSAIAAVVAYVLEIRDWLYLRYAAADRLVMDD